MERATQRYSKRIYELHESDHCIGIENQSTSDENEPIRVMGYAYGSYCQQIVDEKKLHPVITIVLNFTDKIWSGKKSLLHDYRFR